MSNLNKAFFLGANSPIGPYNIFNLFIDEEKPENCYIIKGGPGSGKSSFMRAVGDAAEESGKYVEYFYCPSDPSSLDGIWIPQIKTAFIDGTTPHIVEPPYPGVLGHIINLGSFWNISELQKLRDKIMELSNDSRREHEKCDRFLAAAQLLQDDTTRAAYDFIDFGKIEATAERFVRREFKRTSEKTSGKNTKRFLSAISPDGLIINWETVQKSADKVFVLEDDWGVGGEFIRAVREKALANGYDTISCNCPLEPRYKLEHLLIPQARFALITQNRWHLYQGDAYRKLHATRFIYPAFFKRHKARISFNNRASRQLLEEAVKALASAKTIHDELEQYYKNNTDFAGIDIVRKEIIECLINPN